MLTLLDESLLHQIAETFAHTASQDHRFFDRMVVGIQAPDGDLALVTSFGVYKNNNVMDGFAMLQANCRKQYNQRFSRSLRPNLMDLVLGPLSIEILEPLKRLRVRLRPGDYPASYDIEWSGVLPPHLEERHFTRVDGRVVRDHLRWDQLGTASGWISIDGKRRDFENWFGWRDHSWGVRPAIGGYEPYTGSRQEDHGSLVIVIWWLTDSEGGLVQIKENGDGQREYLDGHIFPRNGEPALRVTTARHEIHFIPGTRIYDRMDVTLTDEAGKVWEIAAEGTGRAWAYKGSGYAGGYNDERGLGLWRGHWVEEYDVYDIADVEAVVLPDGRTLFPVHREQFGRVTVNRRPGLAHTPVITTGTIARYGLVPREGTDPSLPG
jgi:hypothetical protein